MKLRHRIVSAGLAVALAGPLAYAALPASVAVADPASDLDAAAAQLDSLGASLAERQSQLAEATSSLESTDYEIAEKQAQVDQTRQALSEKQAQLGDTMRSSYKSGSTSLLDFVLGSSSAEELVSRIYYLDKVSDHEAAAIEEVRALVSQLQQEMGELEQRQAGQQRQVDDLQAQVSDYQAQVAEARAVYESLDAELQAQLQAQQSANVSTAIGAIESDDQLQQATGGSGSAQGGDAPATGASDGGSGQDSVTDDVQAPAEPSAPETPSEPSTPSAPSEPTEPEAPSTPSTGGDTGSSAPAGGGLATAYAQLGKPYVYGATGPNAFDCSGLICYCYGYARGRTTYAMISSLQATGDWKTSLDQLNVGDLVFPHSGHVGIYVGNGQYLHASSPGVGVIVSSLSGFIGGGSYY